MLIQLRRSAIAALFFLVICGLAYPLAATGVAQAMFAKNANGSLGNNGSALIGQNWKGPSWFHGRPDAYNPMISGASNLGPTSRKLEQSISSQIARWHRLGVANPTPDLVESSGSGLDPDISVMSAYVQVPMISKARAIPQSQLRSLINRHTTHPEFGFLGNSYVNVLELNQGLARLAK